MPKKPPSTFNIWLFSGTIVVVFIVTFAALYVIGAVPASLQFFVETPTVPVDSSVQAIAGSTSTISSTAVSNGFFISPSLPQRIIISTIGVNSVILNPQTSDVVALDNDLLRGAVRYPTSGALGQGTVFLFGHNTGLPAINPAYKTFNGLRTLKTGAQIEIDSATERYFYSVTSLTLVNSTTAYVTISNNDNQLVISTCNVFGAKEQRYIVHASFVRSELLTG